MLLTLSNVHKSFIILKNTSFAPMPLLAIILFLTFLVLPIFSNKCTKPPASTSCSLASLLTPWFPNPKILFHSPSLFCCSVSFFLATIFGCLASIASCHPGFSLNLLDFFPALVSEWCFFLCKDNLPIC